MIYLIAGHPRTGTSMMMQALERGGLQVVRSDSRDAFNDRHSDRLYRPNPQGLYEPDLKDLQRPGVEKDWDGKALKLVVGWLQWLPVHAYRAVFMHRDNEESRQSFEAAFSKGRIVGKTVEEIQEATERGLNLLRNRKDVHEITEINYRDVIENPLRELSKLDWGIDAQKAAQVVDPALFRFRRENLVKGI